MSVTIKVYGHSDDVICVTGGKLDDEFYDSFLHFDDGTILQVKYNPKGYSGKWKIEIVKQGAAKINIALAKDEILNYSDIATLTGEITGIEAWENNPPARYETMQKIAKYDLSESRASNESLMQAWRLISGDK